jgi:hypothetical protein
LLSEILVIVPGPRPKEYRRDSISKEAHMKKCWRIGLCLFCFSAVTIAATAQDDDELVLRTC